MGEYVDSVERLLKPFAGIEDRQDDHACAYATARVAALDLAHELDGEDRCMGCNEWLTGKRFEDVDGWLCEECADACREDDHDPA